MMGRRACSPDLPVRCSGVVLAGAAGPIVGRASLRGDHPVRLPGHHDIRHGDPRRCGPAARSLRAAVLRERVQRPRYSDQAMTPTIAGQYLLIRRLISRPDQYTFYLCWVPPGRPATMTYFVTIAGRKWPAEETFRTGKDVYGWDQTQARAWHAICRHTALAALARPRAAAIRSGLTSAIALPAACGGTGHDTAATPGDDQISDADLQIPLGGAPVPARGGQPRLLASRRSSCRSPRPPGSPSWPPATPPG